MHIKELEKLIGNLVFASWVIPFGRSFISHISFFMNRENSRKRVTIDAVGVAACDVWALLLKRNRGLPFDFIFRTAMTKRTVHRRIPRLRVRGCLR